MVQNNSFDVNQRQIAQTRKFNNNLRYVQGYRNSIAGTSTTPITITLNAAGRELLGIAIFPVTGLLTTLADTQIKFVVNNNNLLLNVGANSLNPNFVQGMIFFPTPQPLFGNDSISLEVTKNDATAVIIIANIFYVPRV